jgi:hypothetical protein
MAFPQVRNRRSVRRPLHAPQLRHKHKHLQHPLQQVQMLHRAAMSPSISLNKLLPRAEAALVVAVVVLPPLVDSELVLEQAQVPAALLQTSTFFAPTHSSSNFVKLFSNSRACSSQFFSKSRLAALNWHRSSLKIRSNSCSCSLRMETTTWLHHPVAQ